MIPFTKMQGIGNDFVLLDCVRGLFLPGELSDLAVRICDRRYGVGGDGLILALRGEAAPFRMRMFNPDGSESEMCGNGIRCFAVFLKELGYLESDELKVETGGGILHLRLTGNGMVTVNVGAAQLSRNAVGMWPGGTETFVEQPIGPYLGTAVSMGNPHLVIFVQDVRAIELPRVGRELERSPLFPNRINVHFVQAVDRTHLIQRTWERGAGETLACGTGACSVAVAGFETGRSERQVEIQLPGGNLWIDYSLDGHVQMTGPATTVCSGMYFDDEEAHPVEADLAGIGEVELLEHT